MKRIRISGLCLVVVFMFSAMVAATAQAGLPDGRVYEQVSSQKKNGNEAGVTTSSGGGGIITSAAYGTATPGGDRVVYFQSGPSGETCSGADLYSVSRRNPETGWEVSSVVPPAVLPTADFLGQMPLTVLASADLSRFLFVAQGPFVKENSVSTGPRKQDENEGLYRTRGNCAEPEWLTRPTFEKFSQAKPEPGKVRFGLEAFYPVGGSADLSTVYFTYFGTLVPTDASRAPHVEPPEWSSIVAYGENDIVQEANGEGFRSCQNGNINNKPSATQGECAAPGVAWEKTVVGVVQGETRRGPWGFYEWHNGALHSAGELPDHTYSPYGAVPAVTQRRTSGALKFPFPRLILNEVSQDGSRAFFISPDGALHASEAGTPVELYVREQTPGGPKTVLVSRDELEAGNPAPAPACTKGASNEACAETAVTPFKAQRVPDAYVYASPDGSRAFFQSKDKLAKSAANKEPEGSGPWTYEFNVASEKVTYLPGVVGPIAASSQDGSSFIFKNTGTKKIELWTGGPAPVETASFSTPAEPEFEGTATKDGGVYVFNTNAVLKHGSQEFNNSAGLLQAYRYEVSSQRLSCVSCAPQGVPQHRIEEGVGQAREIAAEGRRVFFATATQLLPQAINGVEDVYEWEQAGTGSCHSEEREGGCVYLLSSGTSPDPSFYLDNDESGENVFFATKAGLVKGDTDESYDVYDARVGGGFPPTVVTERASSFTQTAATLNGIVDPNGSEVTDCKFEYGSTAGYGKSAPCTPMPGSGELPVAVSAAISGLSANTSYHFRIVAKNAGGERAGSDVTVKTLPNPPTVATEAASSVAQTTATLNATVNPEGGSVSKCTFEYGSTTSYGVSVPCSSLPGSGTSPVGVSAGLTGLSVNTTYHFRVVATNAGGTSHGADQTFKTLPEAPTVVTGGASDITRAAATLDATVNPNGKEVTECRFEYGPTASYGSSVRCTPSPGSGESPVAVFGYVQGLSANTTYHFRVVATNAGTSDGSDMTFKTPPNPPAVVTGAASAITQTAATLTATVNPESAEVGGCKLEYGTTTSYGSSATCSPAPGSGTSPVAVSAQATGLSANTTYHFRVVATNAGGTSEGADVTFKALPNAPTVATGGYVPTEASGIVTGAVNPNGGTVTDCHFEYGDTNLYGSSVSCTSLPGSGTQVVEVSAPVGGLIVNATYHFRISATNAGGTSYGTDQTFTFTMLAAAAAITPQITTAAGQGVLPAHEQRAPVLPDVELATNALTVNSTGRIAVRLTCPATEILCKGTVTLRTVAAVIARVHPQPRRRFLTLAAGSFTAPGGRVTTVTLHLSGRARRLLARVHVLRALATIVAHDASGASHTSTAILALRMRKTAHHGRRG